MSIHHCHETINTLFVNVREQVTYTYTLIVNVKAIEQHL